MARQTLCGRWVLADESFGRDPGRLDGIADLGLWYLIEVLLKTALWLDTMETATIPQTLFRTLAGRSWSRHWSRTAPKNHASPRPIFGGYAPSGMGTRTPRCGSSCGWIQLAPV